MHYKCSCDIVKGSDRDFYLPFAVGFKNQKIDYLSLVYKIPKLYRMHWAREGIVTIFHKNESWKDPFKILLQVDYDFEIDTTIDMNPQFKKIFERLLNIAVYS